MGKNSESISLRMRWQFYRARYSTPALLSRCDEKRAIGLVTAIHAAITIITISGLAWLTDLPLLFPALGPSTFILFSNPLSIAGAPRSVIGGHLLCLGCGYGSWHLVSWLVGSPVGIDTGGGPLYLSAALGLALGALLLVRLNCPHPPACASSLVVALGMVTHLGDMLLMGLVVIWMTFQAILLNRFAGLPVPFWSATPREKYL
ncbi:MAG: HPP family protein [Sedimentisphaerales bacterium]|nr:HPP family protein [Sedimentisphaerales bacterium]